MVENAHSFRKKSAQAALSSLMDVTGHAVERNKKYHPSISVHFFPCNYYVYKTSPVNLGCC